MQKTKKNMTKKNMKPRAKKTLARKKMGTKMNKPKRGSPKRKLSEWQLLVKKTVKDNPNLTFGECLKLASKNRNKK